MEGFTDNEKQLLKSLVINITDNLNQVSQHLQYIKVKEVKVATD